MGTRTDTAELPSADIHWAVTEALREARAAAEREELRRAAIERADRLLGRGGDRFDPRDAPGPGQARTGT